MRTPNYTTQFERDLRLAQAEGRTSSGLRQSWPR